MEEIISFSTRLRAAEASERVGSEDYRMELDPSAFPTDSPTPRKDGVGVQMQ